jgi:hypothetical protein
MRLRPIILSPLLRWFAAVTLVTWLGAQALCQAHCLFEDCHDETGGTSCHAIATATSHHGDDHDASQPGHEDDSADSCCLTIKSALSGNSVFSLVIPEFSVLYAPIPITSPLGATTIEPVVSFSCQAQLRDWTFTPELRLGPAFRSHAPPFSSLA